MIESIVWPRIRKRLGVSARAFSTNARNRNLRRAQLAFGAAWTAEWTLTVVLGVVAYRDGGATAAGVVAFVRIAPAAAVLAVDGSLRVVYGLAVVATAAFTVFRPAHSALLPGLCMTPLELTSANVIRGFVDSVS